MVVGPCLASLAECSFCFEPGVCGTASVVSNFGVGYVTSEEQVSLIIGTKRPGIILMHIYAWICMFAITLVISKACFAFCCAPRSLQTSLFLFSFLPGWCLLQYITYEHYIYSFHLALTSTTSRGLRTLVYILDWCCIQVCVTYHVVYLRHLHTMQISERKLVSSNPIVYGDFIEALTSSAWFCLFFKYYPYMYFGTMLTRRASTLTVLGFKTFHLLLLIARTLRSFNLAGPRPDHCDHQPVVVLVQYTSIL